MDQGGGTSVGTSSAPTWDDVSDFEVSDVEGEMDENERKIKMKEKKKKKMKEIIEREAQARFEEKMKIENEKKNPHGSHSIGHSYESHPPPQNNNSIFSTVPLGKPPHFDGSDYGRWCEEMESHLVGLNPDIWTVVVVGVRELEKGEVPTSEHAYDLYRNAQALRVIKSSLSTSEYNKVRGMTSAKEVWETLQMAHEGDEGVKEGKMDLLQARLEAFSMKKEETVEQMHDRLTLLVNEIRNLGSKDWMTSR